MRSPRARIGAAPVQKLLQTSDSTGAAAPPASECSSHEGHLAFREHTAP